MTTEEVAGLYHRKLRTVVGRVSEGSKVVGGRQTARDLFDLYVLSQAYMPIRQFIAQVPYAFPSDAFDNGLASMPWLALADELQEITCDPKWDRAKDILHLQESLFQEIGATAVDDLAESPGRRSRRQRSQEEARRPTMKRLGEVLQWSELNKKAYWDRDVPLATWQQRTSEGHPSYFPQAVSAFDPVEFIHYYGVSAFKDDWPALKEKLDPAVLRRHAPMFDLTWSRLVGKSWNLPLDGRIIDMPARKREFLAAVSRTPGVSIYEIANMLGMQYRRAHDHAKALSEDGLVRMRQSARQGRMRNLLFPAGAASSSHALTATQRGREPTTN